MPFVVPGIGYVGLGSTTRAAQAVFSQAMGRKGKSTGARRKRAATGTRSRPKKRRAAAARRATRGNRFTKGSAAAKRHMAKLRKMRKR
jgi:hypothetical protein